MYKRPIIILLACIFLATGCEEDYNPMILPEPEPPGLHGFVLSEFNEKIEGAIINAGGLSDTTDSSGYYSLVDIPEGNQAVECIHSDYDLFSKSINFPLFEERFDITLFKPIRLSGTVYNEIDGPLSGAVVNIGGMIDTTDNTGYYEIKNMKTGRYNIECHYQDYFTDIKTVQILNAEKRQDIQMKRTLETYIYPEEDATVMYSTIRDEWSESNFGYTSTLIIASDYRATNSMPNNIRERIFIKLPHLPDFIKNYMIDSVLFQIKMNERWQGYDCCFSIRKVKQNWEEEDINWNNQPEVSVENLAVPIPSQPGWLEFDVSDYYPINMYTYGMRIAYSWEEKNYPSLFGYFEFVSCEAAYIDDRPRVYIKYTY